MSCFRLNVLATLAGLTGLAMGSGASGAEGVGAAGYEHYHFKQREVFPLDQTRIAVQLTRGAALGDLAAVMAKSGLDLLNSEAHAIEGWYLVPVLPAFQSGPSIENAVRTISKDQRVAFVSPIFVGLENLPLWPTQDLLVEFNANVGLGAREALLKGVGATKAEYRWQIMPNAVKANLETKDGFVALAASNRLALAQETTFAECDMIFTGKSNIIPNDTYMGDLWGIHNTGQAGGVADQDMDGPEAWDTTTGSASVITIIMDIGVQQAHPDLNSFTPGNDLTGNGTGGEPGNACDNHGTAVASCISGRFNNGLGVVGIAPSTRTASTRIGVSSLTCNGTWSGNLSWSADAINWGVGIGARVSNNSNSYGGTSAAVETAYTNSHNINNMVHFASAGNSGAGTIAYPSSAPNVNSVAALNRTGARASFSQFGTGLDFSAPGETIYGCDRTGANGYVAGDYVIIDGTSFASPYAAGVAALVISRNPALTSVQVESIMQTTSVNLGPAGYDTGFGWGFVNANLAVLAASPPPTNNICAGATDVSATGTFFGTLVGATNDGTSTCGGATNPDVWYTFTAPGAGTLRVTTCGTHDAPGLDLGMDTIVSLLSACGGTQLACNDDSFTCPGQDTNIIRDSDVSTVMTPGQNVKIRVTKFGSVVSGPFRINVSFTLANDACANAIDVSAGGTYVGTLVLATNDGTATCGASATNPDVWYTYTNSTCNARRLQVTGCGSNSGSGIDTVISILASCGGAELGCNDDSFNICAPATSTLDSVVSAVVLPGQNVKIRVSKFGSRIVNFFYVNVTSTLANDLCADALLVGAGDHGFCNTGAATDGPAACGVLGSDLWYRYTATATGLVTVSTCGPSSFDTALGVYADGCPAGATLACNDDDFNIHCGGGYIRDAWLQFSATSGTTYLIQVGGYASGQGSGTLHIVGAGCHGLCVADVDDGSGTGTPDGGTGIEDLLYYLGLYDAGLICADTDDGSGTGTPDGGVGIEDLLYYLGRYDAGC